MSVYRNNGPVIKRVIGGIGDTWTQLKIVDFRPLKKLVFQFDPFSPNIGPFRDLIYFLSAARIRDTNPKCLFKTTVVSDRSDPELLCSLENGNKVIFKAKNLSTLEILEQLNKITLPLLPVESSESVPIPQTKSQKKR